MLFKDALIKAKLCTPDVAEVMAPCLQEAQEEFHINTPLRIAAFLATCSHESGLVPKRENMNYSAERLRQVFPKYFTERQAWANAHNPEAIANNVYANRMGNGPKSSGDGWAYRGGGILQITGRSNYRRVGGALGIDLEHRPYGILEPRVSARAAAWFWQNEGCNELADCGQFETICVVINLGRGALKTPNAHQRVNGLADRVARYNRALKVFTGEPWKY